jgi:(p)ppGpp synthase/HD superfamily hydrolase
MFYLWYTSYGIRHRYDVIINLHWARPLTELAWMTRVLQRHARNLHCATQRSSEAAGTDFSYRLLLRDPDRVDDLIHELRAVEGVSRVTAMKAQEESEL